MNNIGPSDYDRINFGGGFIIDESQKRQYKIDQTPEERFVDSVSMSARNINSKDYEISFSEDDIDFLTNTSRISAIKTQYLNPTAYILGYYITEKFTINERRMIKVLNNLNDIDEKMKPVDLIRYARFWINLK